MRYEKSVSLFQSACFPYILNNSVEKLRMKNRLIPKYHTPNLEHIDKNYTRFFGNFLPWHNALDIQRQNPAS